MTLPTSAHTSHPWRIHEIAYEFELLDVWALPTPGGPNDFPELIEVFTELDPGQSSSFIVRFLFAFRAKLGELFGWDDERTGIGSRVESLRERMPPDLEDARPGAGFEALPAQPLYLIDDEFAAEVANQTVHGVLHVGWVPDENGGYRGQMAILIKPNGILGKMYVAGIGPFRHLVVYPALLRELERSWRDRTTPVAH